MDKVADKTAVESKFICQLSELAEETIQSWASPRETPGWKWKVRNWIFNLQVHQARVLAGIRFIQNLWLSAELWFSKVPKPNQHILGFNVLF